FAGLAVTAVLLAQPRYLVLRDGGHAVERVTVVEQGAVVVDGTGTCVLDDQLQLVFRLLAAHRFGVVSSIAAVRGMASIFEAWLAGRLDIGRDRIRRPQAVLKHGRNEPQDDGQGERQ